jgi:phosphatidylinositol kinase/protein kinase (PI-3  family)
MVSLSDERALQLFGCVNTFLDNSVDIPLKSRFLLTFDWVTRIAPHLRLIEGVRKSTPLRTIIEDCR